jgi:hypothetical protein
VGFFWFGGFMNIKLHDKLEMKKSHPCGGKTFTVLRLGSDLKVKCDTCGHEMLVSRIKLEKHIKSIKSMG